MSGRVMSGLSKITNNPMMENYGVGLLVIGDGK
jgi:hypothetical protein